MCHYTSRALLSKNEIMADSNNNNSNSNSRNNSISSKIVLFEYIVTKLIGVVDGEPFNIEGKNEELRRYNLKYYMKTLYFLCLASYLDENGRITSNIDYKSGLFSVLDSFTAYPAGPVERDIYHTILSRKGLNFFEYDGDVFKIKNSGKAFPNIGDDLKNQIDNSFRLLFSGSFTPPSKKGSLDDRTEKNKEDSLLYAELDTQMLIDLSHLFPFWKTAFAKTNEGKVRFYRDISKLIIQDSASDGGQLLQKELNTFLRYSWN